MIGKKYYLTIKRKKVFVKEEIYKTYYSCLNKEKYSYKMSKKYCVSLEYELEDVENLSIEDMVIDNLMVEKLYEALDMLDLEERMLIDMIYFEGLSERVAARELGLTQGKVHAWKLRIIRKLNRSINKYN